MLNRLPPYSRIILSTSVTLASRPTSRRASEEPMKPRPPVTRTSDPEKIFTSKDTTDCKCRAKDFPIIFRRFLTRIRQIAVGYGSRFVQANLSNGPTHNCRNQPEPV